MGVIIFIIIVIIITYIILSNLAIKKVRERELEKARFYGTQSNKNIENSLMLYFLTKKAKNLKSLNEKLKKTGIYQEEIDSENVLCAYTYTINSNDKATSILNFIKDDLKRHFDDNYILLDVWKTQKYTGNNNIVENLFFHNNLDCMLSISDLMDNKYSNPTSHTITIILYKTKLFKNDEYVSTPSIKNVKPNEDFKTKSEELIKTLWQDEKIMKDIKNKNEIIFARIFFIEKNDKLEKITQTVKNTVIDLFNSNDIILNLERAHETITKDYIIWQTVFKNKSSYTLKIEISKKNTKEYFVLVGLINTNKVFLNNLYELEKRKQRDSN